MRQDVFDLDAVLSKGPGAKAQVFDLDAVLESQPPKSALRRFAGGVVDSLNPVNIAEGLGAAAGRGLAAIDREGLGGALASGGRAMVDAQSRGLVNAWDLAGEGRTTEALGQAVSGVLPIVGPMARGLGEEAAQTGDLAGALGQGVGMALAPRAASKVPPAVRFASGRVVEPLRKVGGKVLEAIPRVGKNTVAGYLDTDAGILKSMGRAVRKEIKGVINAPEKAAREAAKKAAREAAKKAAKAKADKPPTVTVPGETGPKVVSKADEGALFDAKTGQPVKMTPEQAKAAVDDLPWNKSKATKSPAQVKFEKVKAKRVKKSTEPRSVTIQPALKDRIGKAISPDAAWKDLQKHGAGDGKRIPKDDARAMVDEVWSAKEGPGYTSIEQWMTDRRERWNSMRTSSKKKGN